MMDLLERGEFVQQLQETLAEVIDGHNLPVDRITKVNVLDPYFLH